MTNQEHLLRNTDLLLRKSELKIASSNPKKSWSHCESCLLLFSDIFSKLVFAYKGMVFDTFSILISQNSGRSFTPSLIPQGDPRHSLGTHISERELPRQLLCAWSLSCSHTGNCLVWTHPRCSAGNEAFGCRRLPGLKDYMVSVLMSLEKFWLLCSKMLW